MHSCEKLELLSGQFTVVLSGIVLCYKRMPLGVKYMAKKGQSKLLLAELKL